MELQDYCSLHFGPYTSLTPPLLLSACSMPGKWEIMYLCTTFFCRCIELSSLSFSIEFWNWSVWYVFFLSFYLNYLFIYLFFIIIFIFFPHFQLRIIVLYLFSAMVINVLKDFTILLKNNSPSLFVSGLIYPSVMGNCH